MMNKIIIQRFCGYAYIYAYHNEYAFKKIKGYSEKKKI